MLFRLQCASLLKMSVVSETSVLHDEADDSFVSISLESTESCDICKMDTDEQLTSTCHLCLRMFEPTKLGFNKIPDTLMLHSGVVAHRSCLEESHQAHTHTGYSYHISPLLHRRGTSVPSHFTVLETRDTSSIRQLQWLINYAKNEDIQKHNRLQVHSNPCTRASSPVIFSSLGTGLPRRNSENNLRDPSFLELRKSYTRYLYGNGVTKSHSDDNVECKTRSSPSFCVDGPDGRQIKGLNLQPQVPFVSIKNQTVLTVERTKELEHVKNGKGKFEEIKTDISKDGSTNGSAEDLEHIYIAGDTCSTEEKGMIENKENLTWSNKRRLDMNQLNKMSTVELKNVVSTLGEIIKGISAELVEILQERDAVGQEVRVRNLTIQKLVKLQHSQQDAPIKTTGVGNI